MMQEGTSSGKDSLVASRSPEDFDEDQAYRDWDLCILFDNLDQPRDKNGNELPEMSKEYQSWEKIREERVKLRKVLTESGLKTKKKEIRQFSGNVRMYLLISASQERLEIEAERIGLEMKLKLEHGGAYSAFEVDKRQLFENGDLERGLFFRKTQSILLLESIIESNDSNGCNLSISDLKRRGIITKIFPLHNLDEREWLLENWAKPKNMFKVQPIDRIRLYFGEELAMYFAWLGFYTSWLWIASAAGLFTTFFWMGRISSGTSGYSQGWVITFYAIFLALWATFFLEFWKRYSNTLLFNWGMENFQVKEQARADYKGIIKPGLYFNGEWIEPPWGKPITQSPGILATFFGKKIEHEMAKAFEGRRDPKEEVDIDIPTPRTHYYPSSKRFGKIGASIPIIVTMATLVIIFMISIMSFRLFMQAKQAQVGAGFGGVANAIVIMILNNFWRKIAEILTRWENHRTNSSYQNNLIFKIFMFQFVNSYSSLYYIAFFKGQSNLWGNKQLADRCKVGKKSALGRGCVDELAYQLATILITNIVVGQATEVIIPWISSKLRIRSYEKSSSEDVSSQFEREALFNEYPGTFDEYNEMVIQYGYITLFAAAFPLAPVLAVINNMIEIRTDSTKFLKAINRPFPRGTEGIGTWYVILEVLGIIAVTTNCLLIAFSYSTLYEEMGHNALSTFGVAMIIEHILFVLKFGISLLIPDMPGIIRKSRAKEQYIKEEIYKKLSSGTHIWEKKVKAEEEQSDEFESVHKNTRTIPNSVQLEE